MDGIQPYASGQRPLVATVHTPTHSPSSVKSPSDYLRAVRRRIWLVLAIAIPLGTTGTLLVLRLPAIYQVKGRIEVKQPRFDASVDKMVGNGGGNRADLLDERYVPNAIALLNSKYLIKKVLNDPKLGLPPSTLEGDAAADELISLIKPKPMTGSNLYDVFLEGKDPDRITRILNFLLNQFKIEMGDKSRAATDQASITASEQLRKLTEELRSIQKSLETLLTENKTLAPGGKNLSEAQYEAISQQLYFQQQQATSLGNQLQIEMARPAAESPGNSARSEKIARIEEKRKNASMRLKKAVRAAKDKNDPAIKHCRDEIEQYDADIADLKNDKADGPARVSPADVYQEIVAESVEGVRALAAQKQIALDEMFKQMPNHNKYLMLMEDRVNTNKQITELKQRIAEFDMLAKSRNEPVEIIDQAFEPIVPVKPNRTMYIGVCIVFSLGLGLGLVCFLEHIDHSVKVPEHLTAGLGLPLFGVVPKMLRNARNHRGGHLWTPGTPESIEADAYRNLRASLLGFTTEQNPIVTLLVTSAKAGEGKSTTALNLAATCARAGERVLLMDVDLRRPSLNEVFPGNENGTGLVDILRGDLPWQRTVIQTDLPNLDFLPTGDPRDVPIEVLGSLELRQLLLSLSEHHYDRVILDGPAVLGLADCRMLGRIVDGAVMVVRSGSQELRPLQRAKAMLEQSKVHIVGLIFNGLFEDLQNWSSYGPNPMLEASFDPTGGRSSGASRGLGAPHSRTDSLMAVGSIES